jgi:hypothetical protein
MSVNMSLLEEKVDSAVASQSTPALPAAAEAAPASSSGAQAADPTVEAPPSTAASASDGMEEIDVAAAGDLQTGSHAGEVACLLFASHAWKAWPFSSNTCQFMLQWHTAIACFPVQKHFVIG